MKRAKSPLMVAEKRRDEIMNAIQNQQKLLRNRFISDEQRTRAEGRIADLEKQLSELKARMSEMRVLDPA